MKSFKDSAGRDWLLSIDVDAIERVQALTGIDLGSPFDGEPSLQQKLAMHIPTQLSVLYALIRDQAEKSSVTRPQFINAMKGGFLPKAIGPLLEELADFFREFGSVAMATIVSKTVGALEKSQEAAMAQLEKASGPSSGNAPESSD